VLVTDAAGNITDLNPPAEQATGRTRAQLLGSPFADCFEQAADAAECLRRTAQDGRAVGAQLTLAGARGAVKLAAAGVFDAAGAFRGCCVSLRDETSERAATRFHGLVESAPDAIIIVDADGRIQLVNSQTERLFGFPRAQLLDQPIEMLLPARFRDGHERHRQAYGADPRVRPMGAGLTLHGLRHDGSEFPIEISLSPLQEETWIIAAVRDVTERVRFEQTLRDNNAELQRAIQVKDRFLSSMSHAMRTPLNAVLGFTGTLLMRLPGPLTPDQEAQLRTVQVNADRLLGLIDDLLDLAKIESGRVELQVSTVSALAVMGEVAVQLRALADAKGLDTEIRGPVDDVMLRSDRAIVTRVLVHLARNAVASTPSGRVGLELVSADGPGVGTATFRIRGSGDANSLQRQRAALSGGLAAPEDDPSGDLGLGLHLGQRLARLLGGHLELVSGADGSSGVALILETDRTARAPGAPQPRDD